MTWKELIRVYTAVLAGTDFFTVEVLTLRGLVTYYVLFFIHPESRRVEAARITPPPNEAWMKQIARNITVDEWGFLENRRHLFHDCDTKFTDSFRAIVKSSHVKPSEASNQEPEFEYLRRTLGQICQSRMFI